MPELKSMQDNKANGRRQPALGRELINGAGSLRNAIVLAEIIGPPRAKKRRK